MQRMHASYYYLERRLTEYREGLPSERHRRLYRYQRELAEAIRRRRQQFRARTYRERIDGPPDYRDPRDYIRGRVNYTGGKKIFEEYLIHCAEYQSEQEMNNNYTNNYTGTGPEGSEFQHTNNPVGNSYIGTGNNTWSGAGNQPPPSPPFPPNRVLSTISTLSVQSRDPAVRTTTIPPSPVL